jgi:hypothetical protein
MSALARYLLVGLLTGDVMWGSALGRLPDAQDRNGEIRLTFASGGLAAPAVIVAGGSFPVSAQRSTEQSSDVLTLEKPGQRESSNELDRRSADSPSIEAVGPISPFVIAGGGGSSSGSGFELSGTIGQPQAGAQISASTFAVSSGFWNAVGEINVVVLKKRRGQVTSQ